MPNTKFILALFAMLLILISGASRAQSPAPIVVQAASPATTAPAAATPGTHDPASLQSAIKLLEQIKAANAETLKKQEAALQQLDELQQAAEQLKVFAKRG
jgi:hypothetical protein